MMLVLALLAILPDARLTPGATRSVTRADVCTPGAASQARRVSPTTRQAAFKRYGIAPSSSLYELDHLIPLELGGSNTLANLWPQAYAGTPNAHTKDRLENQMHYLVCQGRVTLEEAQRAIAADWVAALKMYGGRSGPR